ncbi:hypothetical protein KW785_00205 [Candidatus Parcubacteria bacterium]|nr:hypothetical protein [Candidatus Parcubacteria bacterium]
MHILLPKIYPASLPGRYTFFLLGPIKGGGAWQHTACLELKRLIQQEPLQTEDFTVVVPCRWQADHALAQYFIPGIPRDVRQTDWERTYLEKAATDTCGCIIGWLPCEDKINPRNDGQPYARDSYGEIGEWRGRMMCDKTLHFCLGAEEGFPGLDVMKSNFELALNRRFTIYGSLDETLQKAYEIVDPA